MTVQPSGWNFDHSYATLPEYFFSMLAPTPVKKPALVKFNRALAEALGLDQGLLDSEAAAQIFSGNVLPEGALPLAQAYAGHQFGHFTMLGDGRAILLGEHLTPSGARFDLQLKGSGKTPYSRGGDGRAALGPMLREYLISEAMHALGIPTTRSLAVVTTGEPVYRETMLPGAVLTRVASSHLRVGTFQFAAGYGGTEALRVLADYGIRKHHPELAESQNPYLEFLKAVIHRQAVLIAKWQSVGFIHGVMNTDNMAISGETIDYGPCAFMDVYDPATVFSSIDTRGRYAFGNQPHMAAWNLARFAEALLPLLDAHESTALSLAQEALSQFTELYRGIWLDAMRAKLGLFTQETADSVLIEDLLEIMYRSRSDYTNTFLALTFGQTERQAALQTEDFQGWHHRWQNRLSRQPHSSETVQQRMMGSNPGIIPRNHFVEAALAAALKESDYSKFDALEAALSAPFAHDPDQKRFSEPAPYSPVPYKTFCGT